MQVSERPVTQQGMSGMRTAGQGPGRQVLDKSYFMAELRQKKADLIKANEEMEVRQRANRCSANGPLSTDDRTLCFR